MTAPKMHADQLDVSASTVRQLLGEQFPDWRALSVRPVPQRGTVNAVFRVGESLSARFPLRPRDVGTVRAELRAEADAARELFGRTGVGTPEPVGLGEPGAGYPLPWSVQTWLPGTPASRGDAGSVALAVDLARFVREVHAIPTVGRTFSGSGRGGDLTDHDAWVEESLARSTGLLDVARLRAVWSDLRTLPRTRPDGMTHGDLIPGNVLVTDGRLVGVLDVGGFGPADPALDLVGAWHLLADAPRQALRDEVGVDDLDWARGRAWAFVQALGAAWYYARTNPSMSLMGRRTLARVLASAS